jgi:pimeloyl-ACP methyl ester carboxylesterase
MRRHRIAHILAGWAAFTLVAATTAAAADKPALPRFEKADCWFVPPKGRQDGCGYLVTLEDRTKPDGRQVRLPIVVIKAAGGQRRPDPVVFLSGGPGQGVGLDKKGIEDWWKYGEYWPWMKNRDLILFEQRGTGLAEPSLNCTEVDARGIELLQSMRDAQRVRAIYAEATEQCRRRLTGAGIDLARYGTRDTASDLAELRQALGIRQWNLMGVSYGTRLALATLRDHPEGIRAVVLDSPYPPEIHAYENRQAGMEQAFRQLFEACAANDFCRFHYPNLEPSLFQTIAWLDVHPLPVTVDDPRDGRAVKVLVTGQTLIELTRYSLAFDDARYTLPVLLDGVAAVDPGVLQPVMSNLVSSALGLGLGDFSEGKYYAVECNEEIPFNDPQAVQKDAMAHRRFAGFAYQLEDMASCSSWLAGPPDESVKAPIESAVPTLILSGDVDPITPREFATVTERRLKHGHVVAVACVGHSTLTSAPCAIKAAAAFLNNPAGTTPDHCSN